MPNALPNESLDGETRIREGRGGETKFLEETWFLDKHPPFRASIGFNQAQPPEQMQGTLGFERGVADVAGDFGGGEWGVASQLQGQKHPRGQASEGAGNIRVE